jgi:AcrR family transcriptional regulator
MARPRTDIAPRILRAARKRFREKGVDAASLRAIAKDAGTSIGMIYYYHPTKDDLFFAVVEETYEKFLRDLTLALAKDVPLEGRLVRLYERLGGATTDEVEIVRLVVQEALLNSTRFERLIERFLRGHVPLVLDTLLEGVKDGTLDGARHPWVLLMSTFALAGPPQLIRRAIGNRVPVAGVPAGKQLARELVEVLLRGIVARPPGASAEATGAEVRPGLR